jgi:glycosyltransferase involved in cell wall biosynthesis
MKKTIIHFIFSLGRELKEYNNIVVTLFEDNHFENELQCSEYICLNKRSLWWLPLSIFKFRRLIKKYKPDLVHSHLVLPNFIARMGTPRNIPFITTIHTSVSIATDYKKWYIRMLDQFTYHYRKSVIIAVSKIAMADYLTFLIAKPYKNYVLHTFVNEKIFSKKYSLEENDKTFKIASVGALRKGKNYQYLIKAFKALKNINVELHIYGIGPQNNILQKETDDSGVNIILKGQVKNIHELLPQYNLFVMPSLFEGFSLSVLEAMAMRMPLLLSDIPSFREQCEDCAIYFDLNNENDFIQKLEYLMDHKDVLLEKGEQAYNRVINNFTLEHHMTGLRKIYSEALNENM